MMVVKMKNDRSNNLNSVLLEQTLQMKDEFTGCPSCNNCVIYFIVLKFYLIQIMESFNLFVLLLAFQLNI
jgi:hypothetical protein